MQLSHGAEDYNVIDVHSISIFNYSADWKVHTASSRYGGRFCIDAVYRDAFHREMLHADVIPSWLDMAYTSFIDMNRMKEVNLWYKSFTEWFTMVFM